MAKDVKTKAGKGKAGTKGQRDGGTEPVYGLSAEDLLFLTTLTQCGNVCEASEALDLAFFIREQGGVIDQADAILALLPIAQRVWRES